MVADPKNPGLPAPTRVPVADVTAFCLEALGIVAALYHRKATGTAQAVGTSMVAGALLQNILSTVSVEKEDAEWRAATQVAVEELIAQGVTYNDILDVTATGIGGRRTVVSGGANPMMSVYYRSYRTKDGYVALGCLNVRQQRRLNEALELHDPRFEPGATSASISSPEASARFDQMEEAAEREFMTRTTSDWLSFLDERGIACGPVLNLLQVLDSSHHLENEMIVGHEDPWAGTVRLMGFPIRFEETRMRIQRPAAPSGYHTDEVLAWLDYSPDQIRALREEKVVFG
jgi:crotonobetainyl-CoA:carnitine CoA-transferase CaiB-like acyl-CoA transferase